MCGIAGVFDTRELREVNRDLVQRMADVQSHRGPDEAGIHVEPGVGVSHRRLAIIDLANGQQPFYSNDENIVLVYNGEIYNFRSVRETLQACGHTFKTDCDTEVVVYAWKEWGEDCVKQFRGMFAFALWDRAQGKLFLARDRLGIKPLYYALLDNGLLIFASELKSILLHPKFKKELDPQAVEDFFALGYIPDPKTIFSQARRLESGHVMTVVRGAVELNTRPYWDVKFDSSNRAGSEELQHELLEKLREAVRIRLVAEVPLGAFLSGGVDSSAVVALMAGCSDDPVKSCSIAFDNPDFDESGYAKVIAEKFRTDHVVENVSSDDFNILDRLTDLYDEPFADASALPTYRLCELARKRVTVALSGDGGDENFAGYRSYLYHMAEERIRNTLSPGLRRSIFGSLGRFYPKLDWAPRMVRAKYTLQALGMSSVEAFFHSASVFSDSQRQALFSDSFRRSLQDYRAGTVFLDLATKANTDDPLSIVQYIDTKCFLPADILTKVDRASMAHSLEVRVPILDHEFVEWAATVPSAEKLKGGVGKHIFKKSLEDLLPEDTLYRAKKGFDIPIASWLRGPLKDQAKSALEASSLIETGIFETKHLTQLYDQHQSGVRDNSTYLWSLLVFESFLRKSGGHASA